MTISQRAILSSAVLAGVLGLARVSSAGPILYWDMNHVTGSTVADQSGSNAGTAGTGVTFTTATATTPPLNSSTPSQVANLTGTGAITSSATAGTLGISGSAAKSVSVWVDAASASWGGTNGVFQLGTTSSNLQDFSLRVKATSESGGVNQWRAQFWGVDTDFTVANSADHWVNFVLVYDPSHLSTSNNVTIYANGAVAATGTQVLNTAASGENFAVGEWNNANFLTGQIDDVAVWAGPLAPSQVALLAAGTSPSNIVPEPASLALSGVGVLGLLARRRRTA